MFSKEVIGALSQLLSTSPGYAIGTILKKHFDDVPSYATDHGSYFDFLRWSPPEEVSALVVDLLSHPNSARADARFEEVFDERWEDFKGWLSHDGWELRGNKLLTSLPATEESTGVRDRLLELLEDSPLDAGGDIRALLAGAIEAFQRHPPDLNTATVNTRIALETVGRRGAQLIAKRLSVAEPEDKWGAAISFLRRNGAIDSDEEKAIIPSYTFISEGAHVPKGMSEIEWARVSRTMALSLTYFLLQKIHDAE